VLGVDKQGVRRSVEEKKSNYQFTLLNLLIRFVVYRREAAVAFTVPEPRVGSPEVSLCAMLCNLFFAPLTLRLSS